MSCLNVRKLKLMAGRKLMEKAIHLKEFGANNKWSTRLVW